MAFVGRARALRRLLDAARRGGARAARGSRWSAARPGSARRRWSATAVGRRAGPSGGAPPPTPSGRPAFWPWTVRAARACSPSSTRPRRRAARGRRAPRSAGCCPSWPVTGTAPADPRRGPGGRAAAAVRRRRPFPGAARRRLRRPSSCSTTCSGPTTRRCSCCAFLARAYRPAPLLVIGAYRHDELPADAAPARSPRWLGTAETVELAGLAAAEVRELVAALAAPRPPSAGPPRCTGAAAATRSSPGSSPSCSPMRPGRPRCRPPCGTCCVGRLRAAEPGRPGAGRGGRGGRQRTAARRPRRGVRARPRPRWPG